MRPDQILPGHTYQGRAMDCDKTRTVELIHKDLVINLVRRDGKDLGVSEISLRTFAMWAAADVTEGAPQ